MLNSNLKRSPVYLVALIYYDDFLLFHVWFQPNKAFALMPVLTSKELADFECIFHAEFKSGKITSLSIQINLLWWFSFFSVTYDISEKQDFSLKSVPTSKEMADFKCIFHAEFKSAKITSVSILINYLWGFSSFSCAISAKYKISAHANTNKKANGWF